MEVTMKKLVNYINPMKESLNVTSDEGSIETPLRFLMPRSACWLGQLQGCWAEPSCFGTFRYWTRPDRAAPVPGPWPSRFRDCPDARASACTSARDSPSASPIAHHLARANPTSANLKFPPTISIPNPRHSLRRTRSLCISPEWCFYQSVKKYNGMHNILVWIFHFCHAT